MTVHHWGEDPAGTWTLTLEDHPRDGSTASYSRRRGRLISWSLILYGVAGERPNHHGTGNSASEIHRGPSAVQNNADSLEHSHLVGTSEVKELMEKEEESSDSVQIQSKDEMATKQNERRRKWLLKKGFDPHDIDFLIALFETEVDENTRKSAGGNSAAKQKKSEVPSYHRNRDYSGSAENQNKRWRSTHDRNWRSYWNPSKRSLESMKTDGQRIVDQTVNGSDVESWRELVDELSAILEDE